MIMYFSRPKQQRVEERFLGKDQSLLQRRDSTQIIEVKPEASPKVPGNKETPQVPKTGPNGMIIRGMTFYKSEPDPMVADDGDPGENRRCSIQL